MGVIYKLELLRHFVARVFWACGHFGRKITEGEFKKFKTTLNYIKFSCIIVYAKMY